MSHVEGVTVPVQGLARQSSGSSDAEGIDAGVTQSQGVSLKHWLPLGRNKIFLSILFLPR